MAGIIDKLKLNEKQDRRIKLLAKDKEKIKELYATGKYSLNNLAKLYNVSKKTILLIVNPESKRKSDQRIKDTWKERYNNRSREELNRISRNTRHYKQKLYENGEMKEAIKEYAQKYIKEKEKQE